MRPEQHNVVVIAHRVLAEQAARAVDERAAAALPQARQVAQTLRRSDPAARSIAQRALGHALMLGGSVDEAVSVLTRAVRSARSAGDRAMAGEARTKLAHGLLISGSVKRALNTIDAAIDDLSDEPALLARAWGTRGLVHREQGEFDAALIDFDAAVTALRDVGDSLGLQRALINRAVTRIDTFDLQRAVADLNEADAIADALHPAARGLIASNLGHAASVGGDIPEALRQYRRAESILREEGAQLSSTLADRGALLIGVGLAGEAFDVLAEALKRSIDERRTLRVSELRLLLSTAAEQLDDPATAHSEAARALRGFRAEHRPVWAAAAALAAATSAAALGRRTSWRAIAAAARVLVEAGWSAQALDALWLVACTAPPAPRREALAEMATHRSRGPALEQARGWHARALLTEADSATSGRAVRRGLRILDEYLSAVGADDLRAGMARHRMALAELAVDRALARGGATNVLQAVELARATVVVRDTVRPPVDPQLADLLSRYRVAGQDRPRHQLMGLIQERSRIQEIRGRLLAPVSMPMVDRRLGDSALVIWFVHRDEVGVITRVAGRSRLRRLGGAQTPRGALSRTAFAVRRLAEGADRLSGPAGSGLLAAATETLAGFLFEALPELGSRDLVLVPPPFLHATPWHELSPLTGRPTTVAASVRQWLHAGSTSGPSARVLVAAGPGLPGARAEAEAVAAGYGVPPLVGDDATVDRVLTGLARVDLAHLAAHGWLRPDNPQFSELTLADGPLLVHHLDTVDALPGTLVLASCDTGRPITRPGEALLGFAAACLVRGTRTLIAPVAPVPDGSTQQVMTTLHELLRAGTAPAQALAAAQRHEPPGRRAFVCFGAGS